MPVGIIERRCNIFLDQDIAKEIAAALMPQKATFRPVIDALRQFASRGDTESAAVAWKRLAELPEPAKVAIETSFAKWKGEGR
ncbi:MAG: hypothetical protein AB7O45_08170 [Alphaproteobacteria bacterium]